LGGFAKLPKIPLKRLSDNQPVSWTIKVIHFSMKLIIKFPLPRREGIKGRGKYYVVELPFIFFTPTFTLLNPRRAGFAVSEI
jgi:hypothetical protein